MRNYDLHVEQDDDGTTRFILFYDTLHLPVDTTTEFLAIPDAFMRHPKFRQAMMALMNVRECGCAAPVDVLSANG